MEVTDPTTGLGVTVRMRRDLPGYNVTRARRSPRLRWSLPVDIQWQSECIMKFLGQSCACCDLLEPAKGKDDLAAAQPPLARSSGGSGHDTIFVDSKSASQGGGSGEKDTKNVNQSLSERSSSQTVHQTTTSVTSQNVVAGDDVSQRLSPLALDSFPGFPLSPPGGATAGQRRVRRRKQLISTSDMLVPKTQLPEAEVTKRLSPFDVMQSHLAAAMSKESDVMQEAEMIVHTTLPDIAEEESAGNKLDPQES